MFIYIYFIYTKTEASFWPKASGYQGRITGSTDKNNEAQTRLYEIMSLYYYLIIARLQSDFHLKNKLINISWNWYTLLCNLIDDLYLYSILNGFYPMVFLMF